MVRRISMVMVGALVGCGKPAAEDEGKKQLLQIAKEMCACTTQQCFDDTWRKVEELDRTSPSYKLEGAAAEARQSARNEVLRCHDKAPDPRPMKLREREAVDNRLNGRGSATTDELGRPVVDQATRDCLAPIKAVLGRMPVATWSDPTTVAPADRAALATAAGVTYNPVLESLVPGLAPPVTERSLGAPSLCADPAQAAKVATTPALQPEVVVVATRDCEEVDTGTKYRGPIGDTPVMNARCSGSLTWVRLADAKVLAHVATTVEASPGPTPEHATEAEVRTFAGRALELARPMLDPALGKLLDAWH